MLLMWDLNSLTKDQNCTPNTGNTESKTGPPRESSLPILFFLFCPIFSQYFSNQPLFLQVACSFLPGAPGQYHHMID